MKDKVAVVVYMKGYIKTEKKGEQMEPSQSRAWYPPSRQNIPKIEGEGEGDRANERERESTGWWWWWWWW